MCSLLLKSLALKGQKLLHLLKSVGSLVRSHGGWSLWGHNWTLGGRDQLLGKSIVFQSGRHARRQVLLLLLALGGDNLLLDTLALPSAARIHVKVGLVTLFNSHTLSLLLESDSAVV